MNGKNIIIYRNGTAIAGTRVNEIDNEADLIQKRTPDTAEYKEYELEQNSWTVTTNYLVSAVSGLYQMLNVGSTYTLVIGATGQTGSTKTGLKGTAFLKRCRITATIGNLVQGTFVFQGTGALSR